LNGANDLEEFKQIAELLEAELPECERIEVAGAGGFPLWESLEAVTAQVNSFLAVTPGNADDEEHGR
jgi:hypothetical protein